MKQYLRLDKSFNGSLLSIDGHTNPTQQMVMKNRNKLNDDEMGNGRRRHHRPDHPMKILRDDERGKIQDAAPGGLSQSAFIRLVPAKTDD